MKRPSAAFALSMAVVAGAIGHARQKPMFSTRVEAVRVDVLVTDNNRPVPGLGTGDFVVLDNGVEQRLDLMTSDKFPLSVTLALDISQSVVGDRLRNLQAASHGVLAGLANGERAALLTFNENVSLASSLTSDIARVRSTIEAIRPGGQTHLCDATYAGIVVGEAEQVRGLLILFTDGNDTGSYLTPAGVLDVAKRSDIVIYPVAALPPGNRTPQFLKDVAHQTGGTLFEIESTKDLSSVFAGILDEFRHRYLLSYSPSGVSTEGWHRIEVRVKGRRGVSVKARQGYFR